MAYWGQMIYSITFINIQIYDFPQVDDKMGYNDAIKSQNYDKDT